MELVSMIIPVYGVESYLEECLESVLQQTYERLEVILIDDQSPDRCPKICDEFARKDQRVKVYHQKNGGAANARNHGLDRADGTYICFVDSDDKIEMDYVEKLLRAIKESDADVAVCSFQQWYPDRIVDYTEIESGEYSGKEYLRKFLSDWTCGLLWNKMFHKKTLNGIRFEEGHKIDDEFFTYQAILKANKIVAFEQRLYWYRMRKSGVMISGAQYRGQMLRDRLEYMPKRYEAVVKRYPDLKEEYLYNLADNLILLTRQSKGELSLEKAVGKVKKKYWNQIVFGPVSFKMKYSFIRSFFDGKGKDIKKDQQEQNYFE